MIQKLKIRCFYYLFLESLRKLSNLPSFTDIPAVFDRIKQVSNPAIVKKVRIYILIAIDSFNYSFKNYFLMFI